MCLSGQPVTVRITRASTPARVVLRSLEQPDVELDLDQGNGHPAAAGRSTLSLGVTCSRTAVFSRWRVAMVPSEIRVNRAVDGSQQKAAQDLTVAAIAQAAVLVQQFASVCAVIRGQRVPGQIRAFVVGVVQIVIEE
jgi:hypothetical protein